MSRIPECGRCSGVGQETEKGREELYSPLSGGWISWVLVAATSSAERKRTFAYLGVSYLHETMTEADLGLPVSSPLDGTIVIFISRGISTGITDDLAVEPTRGGNHGLLARSDERW